MTAPSGEQELDLEQMWIDAQVEFHKLSGQDPKRFPVLKVEDVIASISQRRESDEKATTTKRVKDVVNKTLTCIQTLGQIAAQGASMVFGPSNLCFNALSYLITTAQNYHKIFTGVADLFERISAFLDRFEVYVETKLRGVQLDVHLKRIIHKLLRSFMRICALSIKITKGPKIFLALEIFSFGSNKGVNDEMTNLENLVRDEMGMSIALILQSAKTSEANTTRGFSEMKGSLKTLDGKFDGISGQLGVIPGYLERRENAEIRKEIEYIAEKQREKIRQALSIDKITDKGNYWRVTHEDYLSTRVPNTGQWLLQDSQFVTWSDVQEATEPIFALQAKEGFGKSHLCSTVIQYLNGIYPHGNQDPRVSVAYVFFQKGNKDVNSVNKALRAIVWQLIQSDTAYRKSVAVACDKPEEFGASLELWKQLVMNLSKTDATFFIIFDGIDEAETELGKPLVQILRDVVAMTRCKGQLHIRVFLTGRPKAFEEIEKDADIFIPKIRLGIRNEDDILRYIDMRMLDMDILKSGQPDIQDLKDRIRKALTEGAQGDFVKLDYKVAEISISRRRKEIEEVLKRAGEDRQDTIAREVGRLNETLGQEDIQDLNEILAWVIGAGTPLKVQLLETVLLLKNGEDSLMRLEQQIRDKYAGLLDISSEDETVKLKSDSIIEYFREKSKATEDQDSGAAADLHVTEANIVKRSLKSVCDDDLFKKFGFEEFFKRKLGKKSALVSVDLDEVPIRIIVCCLKVIDGEQNDRTGPLLEYAFVWLPDHLDQVDLALAKPSIKTYIGSLLIKLFQDEEHINRWWTTEWMWMSLMRYWWLYDDDYVEIALKWFKDSAVIKGFSEDNKEWANSLTSNSKPDEDLLKPTAIIISKRWAQNGAQTIDWFSKDVFWFLRGFITKMRNRRGNHDRVKEDTPPTVKQIIDVEEWAKVTFREFGFYQEAIERFQDARGLDPTNWRADFCLTQTYALQEDYKLAIDTISKLSEVFRANEELPLDFPDYSHAIVDVLGDCYLKLSNYDAAQRAFRENLEKYPDKYISAYKIISLLKKQGKPAEIIEFLQEMNTKTNKDGLSHLVAMHMQYTDDDEYHENISYWYGFVLFYNRETEQDYEEAINIWEQNIDLAAPRGFLVRDSWALSCARLNTATILASVYLQQAKNVGVDSPDAQGYLKRLTFLSSKNFEDDTGRTDTKLLLGRLHRLRRDDEQARDCLRGHVRVALGLLSDGEPRNDGQGFFQLALSFTAFGDDVNALAAWHLLARVYETEEDPEEDVEGDKQDSSRTDMKESNVTYVSGEAAKDPNDKKSNGEIGAADTIAGAMDCKISLKDASSSSSAPPPPPPPPSAAATDNAVIAPLEELTADDTTPNTVPQEIPSSPQAETASSPVPPKRRRSDIGFKCDGRRCTYLSWTFAEDIYACRDCLNVKFERKCLENLQSGTLERKICGKDHDFLHIPAWKEEDWRDISKDHMKVGGDAVAVKEWLNRIRKGWGIDVVD